MIAGPNGSGKSTIKSEIPSELIGCYINPDDIQRNAATQGFLDLAEYGIRANRDEVLSSLSGSSLLIKAGLVHEVSRFSTDGTKLYFGNVTLNAYFASAIAGFLRRRMIDTDSSFTFETVMSSRDKVDLLYEAQRRGYRTYLYYVATEDPIINVSRVANRVKQGGHDVPKDKIISRYDRSLDLLFEAIRGTNRAYIFDNSGNDYQVRWLAEVTEGKEVEIKVDQIPAWFKQSVWDKISTAPPIY